MSDIKEHFPVLPNGLTKLHCRYTLPDCPLRESIIDFISRIATNYIIAKEEGTINEREHIQIYMETTITLKTYQNKFNEKFPPKTTTQLRGRDDKYAKLDKGSTELYVCKGPHKLMKGPPCIISMRGYTDEKIQELHELYWSKHPSIQFNEGSPLNVAEEKVKVTKPTNLRFKVFSDLKQKFPNKKWTDRDRPLVYKAYMCRSRDEVARLSPFIIKEAVYGLMNALIDKEEYDEYLTDTYDKIFGEHYEFNDARRRQQCEDLEMDDIIDIEVK